jgi:large subunit ribosomal protein L6
MSRVGKKPISVPKDVDLKLEGATLSVTGPRGQLRRSLSPELTVRIEEDRILVERPNDTKRLRSLHGLTRTLISNMVEGVTKGFSKSLELIGVGYRASKSGRKLVLSVGYSHPVEIAPPEGIEIEVPNPTLVTIRGYDKETVGQLAATIRDVRPPEPYQGKGIRYAGERVRRKAGKTGKK